MLKVATVAASALLLSSNPTHAIDSSKNGYWRGMIDFALSNNWTYHHGCYPHDGNLAPYCGSILISPADQNGMVVWLQEMTTPDGTVLRRNVCQSEDDSENLRRCTNIDTMIQTREMRDAATNSWSAIASRQLPDTQPTPQLRPPSPPPIQYTTVKEWNALTKEGNTMKRTLSRASDGSMGLVAVEWNSSGALLGGSTCRFNAAGWSDCVNNTGEHYQLKPQSIRWFMSIASGMEP